MEEADPTRFKAVIYHGQPLLLQLSAENAYGFLDICHQNDRKRTKPFYAKFTPDGEKKQVRLPQSNSATAEEAACKLAIYNQTKQEIHMIEYHKKRRSSEVCCLLNCAPHSLPLTIALILLCQVVKLEQERKTEEKLAKKKAEAVEISPAASGREAPCASSARGGGQPAGVGMHGVEPLVLARVEATPGLGSLR